MFFRKRKALEQKLAEIEKQNLELSLENEKLKEALSEKETENTIMNLFSNFTQVDFDFLPHALRNDNIVKIEIHSIMKSGEVDECFVDMWYGVKMLGFNEQGESKEYLSVPIHLVGDGCIYSKTANTRRFNFYQLTKYFADYIYLELQRGFQRTNDPILVVLKEENIENLLSYDESSDEGLITFSLDLTQKSHTETSESPNE